MQPEQSAKMATNKLHPTHLVSSVFHGSRRKCVLFLSFLRSGEKRRGGNYAGIDYGNNIVARVGEREKKRMPPSFNLIFNLTRGNKSASTFILVTKKRRPALETKSTL